MSVQEIEKAITELAPDELARFAEWFAEYRGQMWDQQIARDVAAGKLDTLIKEANGEFESGNCKPLDSLNHSQRGNLKAPQCIVG